MMTALLIRAPIASPISRADRSRSGTFAVGLFELLVNPSEWKCAATVAFIFFVGSLALAPVLMRDQKQLAAEINSKTLNAAAAIKTSPRVSLRVRH